MLTKERTLEVYKDALKRIKIMRGKEEDMPSTVDRIKFMELSLWNI